MAISLNNHETRISTLERRHSGSHPNMSNATSITINTSEKTMDKPGWLIVNTPKVVLTYSLTLNGKVVASNHGESRICYGDTCCTVPVNIGDVLRSTNEYWSGWFIPLNL